MKISWIYFWFNEDGDWDCDNKMTCSFSDLPNFQLDLPCISASLSKEEKGKKYFHGTGQYIL